MDLRNEISALNTEQESSSNKILSDLKNLIERLENERDVLLDCDATGIEPQLKNYNPNDLVETGSRMISNSKDIGNQIYKFSKALDKKFKFDIGLASDPKAFEGHDEILLKIIVQHLIRQGQFDLAKTFSEEAKIQFPEELKLQFEGLHCIVSQIHEKNLLPAIHWAKSNQPTLERNGSNLEFLLHRLHYLHLTTTSAKDALEYAKENLSPFKNKHLPEIQRLLGLLIYVNRPNPSQSPYSDLLSPSFWNDVQYNFTREFCTVLGLSHESPLYASVTVGTGALPTLIKMTTVMKKSRSEWSQSHELPVEIELVDAMRFHSIFVCPVSKEQAGKDNPPMMMPCGHVICQESLTKLAKGSQKFKCPYCPSESVPTQAILIKF